MSTQPSLDGVKACPDRVGLLRYALRQVTAPGLVCEFGVAAGESLRLLVEEMTDSHTVVGFDCFTGLPEDWRPGYPKGTFAQPKPPDIAGAQLHVGMFADTLPAFLATTDEPFAFIHIDCDLYSSTVTVLELVAARMAGTVIVFDEFRNFPGWQDHEYRAWAEFVAVHHVRFEYLAHVPTQEQVAIRCLS